MRGILLLTLILGLAACGGTAETPAAPAPVADTAAPAAPAETAAAPTETAVAPVGMAERVTVEAADGRLIQATLLTPLTSGAAPGVILLHMLGDDRTVWGEVGLAADLVDAGYAVLAVDMRGHGETGGAQDWALAADDLARVWDDFAARDTVDEARTAIVGASIGANMALGLGADRPEVRGVVLLSPGLDYRGVTTADRLAG